MMEMIHFVGVFCSLPKIFSTQTYNNKKGYKRRRKLILNFARFPMEGKKREREDSQLRPYVGQVD
jgi:hypothetical protein